MDRQLEAISGGRAANGRKLGVYVVFCNDDILLKQRLKYLAAREELKHVVLCTYAPTGPKRYQVADEADVTAVIYNDRRRVQTNLTLKKGGLVENKAKEIIAALAAVLPKK